MAKYQMLTSILEDIRWAGFFIVAFPGIGALAGFVGYCIAISIIVPAHSLSQPMALLIAGVCPILAFPAGALLFFMLGLSILALGHGITQARNTYRRYLNDDAHNKPGFMRWMLGGKTDVNAACIEQCPDQSIDRVNGQAVEVPRFDKPAGPVVHAFEEGDALGAVACEDEAVNGVSAVMETTF